MKISRAREIEPRRGYWLLFLKSVNVTVTGVPVEDLDIVLEVGWNMVGGSINTVEAEGVFPDFYQLVSGSGSGYVGSTSFEPGREY